VDTVHVRVRVGGEQYALAVEHVNEIIELGEITPVPGSPEPTLGLRNHNGEIIPAFDLARILQIERDGDPQRLLVSECDNRRAAFAVNDVIDVGPLAGTMQESDSRYLLGSTVLDGEMLGVLAVDALFHSIASGIQ
jgi:purine-binding chemotaxis protein CheW